MRICKNGEWQHVTVDDYFPCYPDGKTYAFATTKSGLELWLPIIEKAFAKINGGSYIRLRGGFAYEAL